MGGWDQGVCVRLVYPAGGPRDPDRALMSPTVPYPPNSPTSCSRWSDVTGQLGMSRPTPPIPSVRPLSPLSQLGFNHWLPTVTRHSQWSTYQTQTERQTCRHSEQTQTHMYMQVCNATDINHMNNLIFSEQVNEMLINTTTKLMV